jgi:hypothetical protein
MILEINGSNTINAGIFPSSTRNRDGNRRVAFDKTAYQEKSLQNRAGGFENIGTTSFSAKKR